MRCFDIFISRFSFLSVFARDTDFQEIRETSDGFVPGETGLNKSDSSHTECWCMSMRLADEMTTHPLWPESTTNEINVQTKQSAFSCWACQCEGWTSSGQHSVLKSEGRAASSRAGPSHPLVTRPVLRSRRNCAGGMDSNKVHRRGQ